MATYVGRLDEITLGYAQAGLNYLMALYSAKEPVTLMPVSRTLNWSTLPKWCQPLATWTGQVGVARDVGFLHHTPDTLTAMPQMAKVNLGLTTLETSEVPHWIIKDLNSSDIPALVVPSQFNKKQFEDSGYTKPIHVVPHTIGSWWWTDPVPPQIPADRPFTFYYVGGWNNRKNPETALRAYLQAFPEPSDNVVFAIKLTGGKNLESYIAGLIEEVTGKPTRDDIWIWAEQWGEEQVRWLHHFGDVFVSTHRGEGFALGPFMAKLIGNPVIATNWSAPIEYLAAEQGDILLPYEMVPVQGMDQQHHHFRISKQQSLMWAEPSVEECTQAMLKLYQAGRGPKTFEGIEGFREKYEWHTIGNDLKVILDKYR